MKVAAIIILVDMIILWAMDEDDHICILLNGTGFTKVGELGALAFESFTTLHTTIQLTQRQNGNVKFLSKTFQRS